MTKTELHELIVRAKTEQWAELDLSGAGLEQLPKNIVKLEYLRKIDLRYNNFIIFPHEISKLIDLQELDISNNQIAFIPDSVSNLVNLQKLDISNNRITLIPNEISRLVNLQELNLSNNHITVIPDSISNLKQLEKFFLWFNQILVFPKSITKLLSLQVLYLNGNKITELPIEIGDFTNLQQLHLFDNQIIGIPKTIANLKNLQVLSIWNNKIDMIPDAITELKNLRRLVIGDNPITSIPLEIIRKGWGEQVYNDGDPQIILDYIKDNLTGERPIHEAKLIFVGFGGTGKTSTIKCLVQDDFDKDEPETHEVQITKWNVILNTQAAENIIVHTWDFGGQQIMHSTHQFFLTERSLYVLVLNGRQGQEDEDAEYWLEIIKSFGKDSPVIIALNKSKATPFDVNRIDLRQKFPNIIDNGFIPTDCEDRTGIDILKRTIIRELDKLDGLRVPFPAKWFSIKDRLTTMTENYIDFEEYRQICRSHSEEDLDSQNRLAHYLNLLGIALNYSDDDRLKDTNILNPHWVTKGVYRVITSDIVNENLGRLTRANLRQILDSTEYPHKCYDFLLCLMRKFELCFRFPETEDIYLIPNLLSKQQPGIATQFDPHYCLNFRYVYPILPEGLLPRFVVRTHFLNKTQTWWRSGTVLDFEGSCALIKADRVDKSIAIAVMDGNKDSRRRLLAIIRSHFEEINSNFKFIVEEQVQLPGHPEKHHRYQDLLAYELSREEEVKDVVNGQVIKTSVKQLLNGVDLPGQRNNSMDTTQPVKVFYSYSHKDETLRDELETHLTLLKRQKFIESWHDRCISGGQNLDQQIDTNLQAADIILLLVSADFIASNYCYEIEMKEALLKHSKGEAVVIPIIIRSVDWTDAPIGKLSALPVDGKAVSSWENRDEAWKNVAQGIKRVVKDINSKKAT
jgi:internalin A